MDYHFCSVLGRQITKTSCNLSVWDDSKLNCTEECATRIECGWSEAGIEPEQKNPCPPVSETRKCSLCKKHLELSGENFGTKKTGEFKKTCLSCEDKYLKTPKKNQKPNPMPKPKQPKTEKPPVSYPIITSNAPDLFEGELDLNQFASLENNQGGFPKPHLKVFKDYIGFSTGIEKFFAFETAKTTDIKYLQLSETSFRIVFIIRPEYGAFKIRLNRRQYRISTQKLFKLNIGKGPWEIKKKNEHVLVADVEIEPVVAG